MTYKVVTKTSYLWQSVAPGILMSHISSKHNCMKISQIFVDPVASEQRVSPWICALAMKFKNLRYLSVKDMVRTFHLNP